MDDKANQNGGADVDAGESSSQSAPVIFSNNLNKAGIACPPSDAKNAPNSLVFRWVKNNPPTDYDFRCVLEESGKLRKNRCPCEQRGVSFFSEGAKPENVKSLLTLPKFEDHKFLAVVQISALSGKVKCSDPSKTGHICLWSYTNCNLASKVTKVIDRDDYV